MAIDIDPALSKAVPGIVGSFIAMWRLQGITRSQRVLSFLGGGVLSHYGTEGVLLYFPKLSQGLTSFVLGLFGMAIAAKVFELIDELRPGAWLAEFLRKRGWI